MNAFDDFPFLPEEFPETVRLFPLPNLVMFPHVLQPLQVFEPRYVALAEKTLATDQCIAMGLLQPGWEKDYDQHPPIEPTVCLGRVVSHHRLDDGRYNLLLLGLARGRVLHELPPVHPYREAQIEWLDDEYPPAGVAERAKLKSQLLTCFQEIVPLSTSSLGPLDSLLADDIPLGLLTDIVAYTLKLGTKAKQSLLEELNVDRRATALLDQLRQETLEADQPINKTNFPPGFSIN